MIARRTVVVLGSIAAGLAFLVSPILQPKPEFEPFTVSAQTVSQSGITVITDGQVSATPDVAVVTVGVQTTGTTAQDATAKNNAIMASVLAKLTSMNISAADLHTSGLNLWPVTDRPGEIVSYTASNDLSITVNNIAQTGNILDAAIQAGANSTSNVRFGIKDNSALKTQALTLAIKASRPKADAAAAALGLTIKGISNVAEDISAGDNYAIGGAGGGQGGGTAVLPGTMTVGARVQITYSY